MIDIIEVIEKLAEAEEVLYYYKKQHPDDAIIAEAHAENRQTLEKVWRHAKELEEADQTTPSRQA